MVGFLEHYQFTPTRIWRIMASIPTGAIVQAPFKAFHTVVRWLVDFIDPPRAQSSSEALTIKLRRQHGMIRLLADENTSLRRRLQDSDQACQAQRLIEQQLRQELARIRRMM
jgi:hypothetical protein